MSKTVGIDLGTTNSLVAIVEQGRPRVLSRRDERLVPSVVGLSEDGRIIVGQTALNQFVLAPERNFLIAFLLFFQLRQRGAHDAFLNS